MSTFVVNPIMQIQKKSELGEPVFENKKPVFDEIELGVFTFRRRTFRDEFKIEAEYSRLTEGIETPTKTLGYFSEATAAIKVLLVEGPDDWDIDKFDPLDPDSYRKLTAVFIALQEKEIFFRRDGKLTG